MNFLKSFLLILFVLLIPNLEMEASKRHFFSQKDPLEQHADENRKKNKLIQFFQRSKGKEKVKTQESNEAREKINFDREASQGRIPAVKEDLVVKDDQRVNQKNVGEENKESKVTASGNQTQAKTKESNPFLGNNPKIYRLGEGDRIAITVWNQPELSGTFNIGPDGRFTMPLVGELKLSGQSRTSATELITTKLEKYYPGVNVSVGVENYTSNQVTILGNINQPGVVYFEKKPKLLDVIARAGGLRSQEPKKLGGCTIMRGKGNMAWVDLDALLNGGNLSLNIELDKNDYVYIPRWEDKLYYVLGEVGGPGSFPWKETYNVLDAIQLAGSYTQDANLSKVQLIRRSEDKIIVFNLKKLLKLKRRDIPMIKEGDIVFVPPNWMSKVSYVISRLNPFSWYFFTTGRATVPGVNPGVDQIAR